MTIVELGFGITLKSPSAASRVLENNWRALKSNELIIIFLLFVSKRRERSCVAFQFRELGCSEASTSYTLT
jgi:hypothetical protein